MNTNAIAALFLLVVSGIIYAGTSSNDPSWTGNRNVCVGECYEAWKETHGGSIASVEQAKQEALRPSKKHWQPLPPRHWARAIMASALPATALTVKGVLAQR